MKYMILADTIPNAVQVNGFVAVTLVATQFLANVALVAVLFIRDRKREIYPQPLKIQFAEQFASKTDFVSLASKNEKEHGTFDRRIDGLDRTIREHIDRKLTEMQTSSEEGRGKLHERIDDILGSLSELKGAVRAKWGI